MCNIDDIDIGEIESAFAPYQMGRILRRMLDVAEIYQNAMHTDDSEGAKSEEAKTVFTECQDILPDSGELLPWSCAEEGFVWRTVVAATAEDALDLIDEDIGSYNAAYTSALSDMGIVVEYTGNAEGTVWIDHTVSCLAYDSRASRTIAIDPHEPNCADGYEHDWQVPHEVVGGIEENPGVWGHGGGIIVRECCTHCGRYRETDTWAQNPDTGEQGLRSVTYTDANDISRTWVDSMKGTNGGSY